MKMTSGSRRLLRPVVSVCVVAVAACGVWTCASADEFAPVVRKSATDKGRAVTVYEKPGWCVWCPSAVALPDGRYALVHSRWRESDGFEAWCAKSEAALAVSEHGPLGPYVFSRTILKGSGRDGDFDRDVVHNPSVFVEGGKYYLFYMGTYSDLKGARPGASSSGTAKGSFRMNQRIGVAVADRIEGPYVRTGKALLPEMDDCIMASNPAVVRMPSGKYLMVFKWGWPPPAPYPHCHNSCAAAIADSPLGPWKVVSKDVFPVPGANFPGEDPCLWLDGDVICCSIHDNGKYYTPSGRALVRFESRDGIRWTNCGELFPRGQISRLERPFVLAEPQGRRLLFAASKPSTASPHSEIIAFPGVLPERTSAPCVRQAAGRAGQVETLVDFMAADGGLEPSGDAATFRPDAPVRQVELRQDGLVVRTDARCERRPSQWIVVRVAEKFRPARDLSDALLRIVLKCPPTGRMNTNLAVNFADRDGEIFQLMRCGESYNESGEFCLDFDVRRLPSGKKGWGTPKANGVREPPLRLDSIAIHYRRDMGGLVSDERGEATFLRIELLPRQNARPEWPRTVVSDEPVSTDESFPGAAPFPGARRLRFRLEPTFAGKAKLTLSHGSDRTVREGTMDTFETVVSNGVACFPVNLPYSTAYQFFRLDCTPEAGSAKGPFRIVEATGEFSQTAAEAMRLEVETGNPLHLVRDGKAERPVVLVRNPSRREIAWTADIVLTDYFGREVKLPFSRRVKPGETVRVAVPWPLPARGLWRVKAAVTGDDGSTAVKEDRFAWIDLHEVTPKVEKPKFRMGIHYHGTKYWPDKVDHTIAALVAAGAKFTRCDYDHMWSDIERRPGEYHWEKADVMVEKLTRAGLALDIIFASPPAWAVTAESAEKNRRDRAAGFRVRSCCAIPREGLFRSFCERYARRYGTKIDYYECGNEWDLTGTGTADFGDLLRVQREAYEGLHAGCPDVCVTPNGWTTAVSNTNLSPKVWQHGLVEFFADHPETYDAWALHCHGEPSGFRENIVRRFLPMRAAHRLKERPWLLNETALTSANGQEDEVASAVWQKIAFGWAMGARDYIWYNLRATGWLEGGEPGYGLITCDSRPRAGYAAFSALSSVAQGLDFDKTLWSRSLRQLFRFRGSSQQVANGLVLIGWDTRQKDLVCRVKVATDAKAAAVVDLMGNRSPAEIADGVVEFVLGYRPAALVLEGATTAEVANPDELAQEDVRSLVIRGKSARPHAVLDTPANVKDLYEANPAMTHRLWKGPADQSARLWFEPDAGGLRVRALVRDDVRAAGDALDVSLTGPDGTARTVTLRPTGRVGTTDAYDAVLAVPGRRFGANVVIHDDDGEGEDSFLFLRRADEGPLGIELK